MVGHCTVGRRVKFTNLQGEGRIPTRDKETRLDIQSLLKSAFYVLLCFQISLPFKKRQDGQMVHQLPPPLIVFYQVLPRFPELCPRGSNSDLAPQTWFDPNLVILGQLIVQKLRTWLNLSRPSSSEYSFDSLNSVIWVTTSSLSPCTLPWGIRHTFWVRLCSDGATNIKRKCCEIFRCLSRSYIWEFSTPFVVLSAFVGI